MNPDHLGKHEGCSNLDGMQLHENVYAISRDYPDNWEGDARFRHIGLYDGNSNRVIQSGRFYFYMKGLPDIINYYLTGHGLLQADKKRAVFEDFTAFGSQTPIFGGYVDSHIGHFFTEVLARGIDFSACKEHPIVFLLLRNRADPGIFFKYCKFFGLEGKRIAIIGKPVIIPKLLVPRPQFFHTHEYIKKTGASQYSYQNTNLSSRHVPSKYFSDKFLEIRRRKGDVVSPTENTIDRILYLSCVKFKNYFGEHIIHRALEEHGHTVIFPEEHSWETVIKLARSHNHVVGLRGSAMHFLMFCRERKKVTYFDIFPKLHHNFYNLEQMMQNDMEYVQVRPLARNLFRYDDIVMLLRKLGIDDLSNDYYKFYRQVVMPNHMEYWRRKREDATG